MNSPRCDRCGKDATIHEYKGAKGEVVSEAHLCEECAETLGLVGQSFKNVEDVLQHMIAKQVGAKRGRGKAVGGCPNCRLTWGEFRASGLLGCPQCYDAFESQLAPLIERAHEGGTHHVGKSLPEHGPDLAQRLQHLRKELADALSSEQYERAAEIRDLLTTLSAPATPAVETEPPKTKRRERRPS